MNTHITFNHHEGGFFSNFNKVITHLAHNHDVSKITWNLNGQPFGAFAYNCGEVFSKLFQPYDDKQKITNNVSVGEFKYLEYTGKNIHELYLKEDTTWRQQLFDIYNKYITPTPLLQKNIDTVDNILHKTNRKKIGILKRNQLLKCEQVNNIMPTINNYNDEINKISGDKLCILSVDNNTDLTQFLNNKDLKFTFSKNIKRTTTDTDMEPHFTPGNTQDALYYFMDVYMLSKCDYLIHPISNMATAALYLNPNLKSIYLQ